MKFNDHEERTIVVRRLATYVPVLVAIGIIISRAGRFFAHPDPLDLLAVSASIALAGIALVEGWRGKPKRAMTFFLLEGALALFVGVRIDLPAAIDIGKHGGLLIGRYVALNVDAPRIQATDPGLAAWDRVNGRGGEAIGKYVGEPGSQVVALGQCADLRDKVRDFVTDQEPTIQRALDRGLGACAAHDGHVASAAELYYNESAVASGAPSHMLAAIFSAMDGFAPVSVLLLQQGVSLDTGRERESLCRLIDRAYTVASDEEPIAQVIRAEQVPRCTGAGRYSS